MKALILGFLIVFSSIATEYDHHSFKKFEYPERSFSIIVTPEGYYPDHLFAFEGEKIRFFVTSTLAEPQCMLLQSHNLFMSAKLGKVTEGETVFDKPGEFNYYCPGFAGKGKIVVLGKNEGKRKQLKTMPINRSLASEVETEWVPED